jgi:hypothetical protein
MSLLFTPTLQPDQVLPLFVAMVLLGLVAGRILRLGRRGPEPTLVGILAFVAGDVYRVTLGLTSHQGIARYAFSQLPYTFFWFVACAGLTVGLYGSALVVQVVRRERMGPQP